MRRMIFDEEHDLFRASIRQFVEKEIAPHVDRWEREGVMEREVFTKAGANGFLAMDAPEEFGGGGVRDFRYNQIIAEEVQRGAGGGAGIGITLHNDICLPYFLHLTDDEQKARWLPGIC